MGARGTAGAAPGDRALGGAAGFDGALGSAAGFVGHGALGGAAGFGARAPSSKGGTLTAWADPSASLLPCVACGFSYGEFFISILRILLVLLRAFGLKLPGNRQNRGHQKSRFTNPGSLEVRRWRRRCRRCCLRGRSTLRCCRCDRTPQPSHQRLRTML